MDHVASLRSGATLRDTGSDTAIVIEHAEGHIVAYRLDSEDAASLLSLGKRCDGAVAFLGCARRGHETHTVVVLAELKSSADSERAAAADQLSDTVRALRKVAPLRPCLERSRALVISSNATPPGSDFRKRQKELAKERIDFQHAYCRRKRSIGAKEVLAPFDFDPP